MPWRVPVLLAVFAGGAWAQGRESVVVALSEVKGSEALPRLLFPQLRPTALAAPAPGAATPRGLGAEARTCTMTLAGKTIPLFLDRPEGAFALGILWCGKEGPFTGRARNLGAEGVLVTFDAVKSPAGPLLVRLHYLPGEADPGVRIEPATHRRGRALLAGEMREVILVDGDLDGRFDGPKDRWLSLRPDRAAKTPTVRQAEALLLSEPQVPFDESGRAFMVEGVDPSGRSLMLVLDTPKVGMDRVLARRYAEVRREYFGEFAEESLAFAQRNALDLGRPRAVEPVRWPDGTLSAAKAAAAAAKRPLLAFYFTESNPWCYRCEFYTFPDREVDALLRRFHLVRIDAEKDPERSLQQGGKGVLPCFVPMTADGRPVAFTMRLREEEGRVRDLEQPERAIAGWQRPEEFAENLRRILKAAGG